jgi:hypothetical protein
MSAAVEPVEVQFGRLNSSAGRGQGLAEPSRRRGRGVIARRGGIERRQQRAARVVAGRSDIVRGRAYLRAVRPYVRLRQRKLAAQLGGAFAKR